MAKVETWPKNCSCGESFDEERWETLRYVGIQKVPDVLGIPDLELRECSQCRSTIATAVPDDYV